MVLTPATHVRAYRREEPMRTTGWSWPAPCPPGGSSPVAHARRKETGYAHHRLVLTPPRPATRTYEGRAAMRTTGWSWPDCPQTAQSAR